MPESLERIRCPFKSLLARSSDRGKKKKKKKPSQSIVHGIFWLLCMFRRFGVFRFNRSAYIACLPSVRHFLFFLLMVVLPFTVIAVFSAAVLSRLYEIAVLSKPLGKNKGTARRDDAEFSYRVITTRSCEGILINPVQS